MAGSREFETPLDKTRESAAAFLIEMCTGLVVEQMPRLHAYDFKIRKRDGTPYALGEFKWRGEEYASLPTYKVDKSKIDNLRAYADKHGVKAIFFAQWGDGSVHFIDCHRHFDKFRVSTMKRKRNAEWRVEKTDVVYEWPINLFKMC